MGISGPTIPALAGQTGVRPGQMGYIFLIGAIGFSIGTILSGRLLDKMNGHRVMGVSLLVSAGFVLLVPVIPSFGLFLVVIMLRGIAEGLLNGVNILLVWTHGKNVAPFITALHFFSGLGAFLAPFLLANLAGLPLGYRWAYWLVGALAILLGLRMLFLRNSPRPVYMDAGVVVHTARVSMGLVLVASLYFFFYVGAERTFGSWIYTILISNNLFSASSAAYITSGYWFSFTLGRLIMIVLATRFRPRQILPVYFVLALVWMGWIAFSTPSVNTFRWLPILIGFSISPLWPVGYTMIGQSLKLTASLSSLLVLGDNIGGMLLPWLAGQVIDMSGTQSVFYFVFGSMLFNFLIFILFGRMTAFKNRVAE